MARAAVVCHLILDHFQSHAMGGIHQVAEVLQGAKSRLDGVEIDGRVPVVVGDSRQRVAVDRRHPDTRDTQFLQISKVIADAA